MKAFLTGLGIGVGLGLLLAPDKGEVTRTRIRDQFGEWSEGLSQKVEDARETISKQAERFSSQSRESGSESRKGPASERNDDAINTLSREELMEVSGIGPILADRIIASRPYGSHAELVERGILSPSTLDELKRHFGLGRRRPA